MDDADIADLFVSFGPVRTRRMFGGRGIFRNGLMFALVQGGELYLKADKETEGAFRHAGSSRYAYSRMGKVVPLSFWRLPEEALDDPDALARWSRLAMAAAARSKAR